MIPSLKQTLHNPERLAALRRTALLDSPTEESFDRLTRLASRLLQVPVVLVSLVDIDRQFFKSAFGLPEPWASRRGTSLSHSFCQHVVASGEELLIEDAPNTALVCENLAIPELGVIAYAGIPLITSDGHVLGSFCAIDHQPRLWTEEEVSLLRDLTASVLTEIELRIAVQAARQEALGRERILARLQQSEEQMRAVLDNSAAAITVKDRDGKYLLANDHFIRLFAAGADTVVGKTDFDLFPLTIAQAIHPNDQKVFETGQATHVEEEIPHDGGLHTYISAKVPLHDALGNVHAVCGILTDITTQKRLEHELTAALAKEHHIAESLQRSLLFEHPSDTFPGIRLATCYEAAWDEASVGGDFFDVFALEDSLVALVVGDASGKGLEAAIRNAEIKYALRAFLREDPQPAMALERLNRFVCAAQRLDIREEGQETLLVLSLLIFNPLTGEIRAATAGAEPPLIVRRSGETEPIDACGLMLGVSPEAEYVTATESLGFGEKIVMVTDGITEARLGGDLFGYERLCRLVQQSRVLGLRQMGQAILDGARAFAGGVLQDDACLLLIQRG